MFCCCCCFLKRKSTGEREKDRERKRVVFSTVAKGNALMEKLCAMLNVRQSHKNIISYTTLIYFLWLYILDTTMHTFLREPLTTISSSFYFGFFSRDWMAFGSNFCFYSPISLLFHCLCISSPVDVVIFNFIFALYLLYTRIWY